MAVHLSDEQIEEIAEKAAEKAVAKMTNTIYREVGRGVVNKFIYILGVVAVGIYAYMQGKGIIK